MIVLDSKSDHTTLSVISYLFTARSFGYVLGSQSGKLYDRLPGNRLLATTLLAMAATMAVVPLTFDFRLLVIVMLVLGARESAADVGSNVLLLWTHGQQVGGLINALHSFFVAGSFILMAALMCVVRRMSPQSEANI